MRRPFKIYGELLGGLEVFTFRSVLLTRLLFIEFGIACCLAVNGGERERERTVAGQPNHKMLGTVFFLCNITTSKTPFNNDQPQ